jgi:hypothetical protein
MCEAFGYSYYTMPRTLRHLQAHRLRAHPLSGTPYLNPKSAFREKIHKDNGSQDDEQGPVNVS